MAMVSHSILLTNSSSLYAGGEFYVLELSAALQKRGHRVWVACQPENLLAKKCAAAGVPIIPVMFPAKGELLKYVGILRKFVREHRISFVHTNTNYDRTAGAFAAALEGARHVTNVHSFHSISHNLTHMIRNRWATDHFLVDGVCVKELLVREDRIASSKISVVHLGVDPETMKRGQAMRRAVRKEFGLPDDAVVVGNVGRLVPFKGQEVLLRAFARVSRLHAQARLLLVGDGELRDPLSRLASELGIAALVSFAGFRDDLSAVYSAFDIYCHASIEGGGETFPFAVLQALSQELPVVVTRVGDVAEMVSEGVNGFVVPDKDPDALASSINQMLADPGRIASMGAQSRELLLKRFTTAQMVDVVEGVYAGLSRQKSL